MGFWGVGPFENDPAADLIGEVIEQNKTAKLTQTLQRVSKARAGDLEDWLAAEGIAAAEMVAAARGNPIAKCPEELKTWASQAKAVASETFAQSAIQAVERILNDSELAELWNEGGDSRKWEASLQKLRDRLSNPVRELKVKPPPPVEVPSADQKKAMVALKKKGVVFAKNGKRNICVSHPSKVARQLRDSDLAHFANLPELTILILGGTQKFTDRGLRALMHLPKLVQVEIKSGYVTDASGAVFAGMKKLQQLDLGATRYGDTAAKFIGTLPALRELNMSQTAITDAGVACLQACRKLQDLGLSETKIADKSLALIAGLTSLRWLKLAKTAVTSKGVKQLHALTKLRYLNLAATQVGDDACSTIGTFSNLVHLDLRRTKITGAGLAKLTSLKRLQRIELSELPLTDKDAASLRQFPKKTVLCLDKTKLSDESLVELRRAGHSLWVGFDDRLNGLLEQAVKPRPKGSKIA